jgi:hypothetical protein
MKHQLQLNVQTPCSENFNKFTPTQAGGFCSSCQTEVIDFTKMNKQEIIDYFSNSNAKDICGRFNNKQLKTYDMKTKKSKKISLLTGIGLACLTLFSFTTLQAQQSTSNNTQTASVQDTFVVKGNVSDENGPLPGANIILKGSRVGTSSDFNGNFEFPQKLKKGDILIFSFVGLETQLVTIENQNSVANITLKLDSTIEEIIVVGKVATKKVYSSKKNKDQ